MPAKIVLRKQSITEKKRLILYVLITAKRSIYEINSSSDNWIIKKVCIIDFLIGGNVHIAPIRKLLAIFKNH